MRSRVPMTDSGLVCVVNGSASELPVATPSLETEEITPSESAALLWSLDTSDGTFCDSK